MSPARVGIIGAGLAGPALAVFLKSKGYEPAVYERTEDISDAGIGIGIQPNGITKVLSQIPGLAEYLDGYMLDEAIAYSVVAEDLGFLGSTDAAKKYREMSGLTAISIRRAKMQHKLVEFAQKAGVPVLWGHKLETLTRDTDSVTVTFANGVQETFSFVVGCDGLHSNTRTCLFGGQPATYTGLAQWGGISPRPAIMKGKAASIDLFGNGFSMIIVGIDEDLAIWALTQREPESKETWGAIDDTATEAFKNSPYSHLPFSGGEVIRSSTKIIKYGLYDCPELECWHKGRVVLIRDAAHPTSPMSHLGQGANQSYEDIGVLVDLLVKHNPSAGSPSLETLEKVFQELEANRIPKSSAMVQGARSQGERKVMLGVEECIKRNNFFREAMDQGEFFQARFGGPKVA